jgi:hypothetical protein
MPSKLNQLLHELVAEGRLDTDEAGVIEVAVNHLKFELRNGGPASFEASEMLADRDIDKGTFEGLVDPPHPIERTLDSYGKQEENQEEKKPS